MERSEIYSASRCNDPTYLCGLSKYPVSREASIGLRTESCVNWDGPISMVSCLLQGNIYTKKKLREWRHQKCIPLVCAITALNCAGRQNTLSRGRQYRAQNGNFGNLGRTHGHGTVFAPRKYLYQMEAMGMERPEVYFVSRCNNFT